MSTKSKITKHEQERFDVYLKDMEDAKIEPRSQTAWLKHYRGIQRARKAAVK